MNPGLLARGDHGGSVNSCRTHPGSKLASGCIPTEPCLAISRSRRNILVSPPRFSHRNTLPDDPCRCPVHGIPVPRQLLPDLLHPLDHLPGSIIPYLSISVLCGRLEIRESQTPKNHCPQSHLKTHLCRARLEGGSHPDNLNQAGEWPKL